MKESEWLACGDPLKMLPVAKGRKARVRGAKLFAAACCRRAWADLADPRSRAAVEALEQFADGPGKQPDKNALKAVWVVAKGAVEDAEEMSRPFWAARAACCAAEPTEAWWAAKGAADRWLDAVETADAGPDRAAREKEAAALADLLRDVFGNPFRPVTIDPAALTPVVLSLARAAYQERQLPAGELDPARLAVLADALEEAGAAGELLAHLRRTGPHVRGCWAIEACLGRS
jgi:hypothetical protein